MLAHLKMPSLGHYLSPHFGQLVQLFLDAEIQDLEVCLGLEILHMYTKTNTNNYTTYIQPKQTV